MFSSAKHPVLTGTAILTCAGILEPPDWLLL